MVVAASRLGVALVAQQADRLLARAELGAAGALVGVGGADLLADRRPAVTP